MWLAVCMAALIILWPSGLWHYNTVWQVGTAVEKHTASFFTVHLKMKTVCSETTVPICHTTKWKYGKSTAMVNHDFNIVSTENFNKCVKNQDVSLLEILPSIELKELGYMNRMCPPLPKNYQTQPQSFNVRSFIIQTKHMVQKIFGYTLMFYLCNKLNTLCYKPLFFLSHGNLSVVYGCGGSELVMESLWYDSFEIGQRRIMQLGCLNVYTTYLYCCAYSWHNNSPLFWWWKDRCRWGSTSTGRTYVLSMLHWTSTVLGRNGAH